MKGINKSFEIREQENTAAFAVIFDEEMNVLLIERKDGKGFDLPGGRREEGETIEMCVVREVEEETGLEVEIVKKVNDYPRKNRRLTAVFICKIKGGEFKINEEAIGFGYFNPEHLPENILDKQKQRIEDSLNALSSK